MILSIDAFSDVGCVREHNEDMILVQGELICDAQIQLQVEPAPDSPFVVAVADGMGGHNGGEFASELAVQSLDDFVHDLTNGLSFEELKSAFDSWIQQIHNFVVNKGNELPEFKNMGTTLVGLLVYENRIFWFNVGDSRLYRFRSGILSQISTDHSMREMYDPTAPSNMICNSIGAGDDVFIDFKEITDTVFDDDLFLLCSDGLNDMVSDEKTESLLETHANAEQLVSEAKQNGGKDNVSVALVGFKIPDVKEVETELPETHDKPNEILKEQPHSDVEYHEEKEPDSNNQENIVQPEKKFFAKKEEKKPDSLLGRLGKFLDGKTKE